MCNSIDTGNDKAEHHSMNIMKTVMKKIQTEVLPINQIIYIAQLFVTKLAGIPIKSISNDGKKFRRPSFAFFPLTTSEGRFLVYN